MTSNQTVVKLPFKAGLVKMEEQPMSMYNYGNTCFFNTALQIITCSPRFKMSISKTQTPDKIIGNFTHVANLDSDVNLNEIHKNLWNELRKRFPGYSTGMQQDCHECLVFFIDLIDEILKKPEQPARKKRKISLGKDYSEIMKAFGAFWWDEYTYRMDPAIKNFHGLYHSSTTCQVCKTENNKWDLFNNISLNTRHRNFTDWSDDFSKKEKIEGYECEKCKKRQTAIRKIEVWRFPKTLILHSINKSFSKISTELVVEESLHKSCKYEIRAIGFHTGATINSGHYYCCINKNHNWWMISDENVQGPINIYNILPSHIKNIYILLYERTHKEYV